MMKKIFLLLLTLLNLGFVFAQIDRSQQPEPGPAPEIKLAEPFQFKMKNGLTVMIVENHKLPRASASLSIDNPPIVEGNKAGVSALTGSLLGKGTSTIDKDAFFEEVDYLGARINFGSQSANASSLSRYFDRVLELMALGALDPQFNDTEFKKEQDLLIEGIRSDEKSVTAAARRVEGVLAYGSDHPFGEFISEESIKNISLEDVKQFYKNYFKPNNAYLVVIGDVDTKAMAKKIKKLFKNWKKGTVPTATFSTPQNSDQTSINFIDMPNAVQSEVVVQNVVDLKMKDPDYFSALMANKILGGGGEARLFLNLREDKGYTYGSYSSVGNNKYTSARFRATASVRNAVTDSSVVELLSEIERIRTTEVTDEELANAKAKYVGDFVLALEQPSTIARYALNIETEGLPKDYYKTYLAKINALTKEDVQRAAHKYFAVDNAKVVVTGKGSEVLENLEKVTFKGKSLPINFYNKYGEVSERPKKSDVPEGLNADKVMQSYIEAIGGTERISQLNSVTLRYEGSMMGATIISEEKKIADKTSTTMYMNNNPMMTMVVTEKEAFAKQGGNKMAMPDNMLADLKNTLGLFPESRLIGSGIAKLEGVEKVGEFDCYKVVIPGETVSAIFYYDLATGLKIQEVSETAMGGQTQRQESSIGDYQEFEGVLFPGKKSQSLGPQKIEMILKDVILNEGVGSEDFE